MIGRKIFNKKYAVAIITVMMLGVAVWIVGTNELLKAFERFPLWSVAAILFALALNFAVVTFRLWRILAQFGLTISARAATRASISGHLASLMVVSMFGQVIGRHIALRRFGAAPVFIATLTAYERVLLVVVSGSICVAGAVALLSEAEILNFLSRTSFIEISLIILTAVMGSYVLGRSKFERSLFKKFRSRAHALGFLESILITVCAQILVLSTFVIGVFALHPDADIVHVAAAAAVISFAASIPITVNGWGIRELTAVYTLGLLGIPTSSALAVSILVGLCSTVVILAAAPLALGKGKSPRDAAEVQGAALVTQGGDFGRSEIEKASAWIIGLSAAILIFFQVHVELLGGVVNVNLADPFALLAFAALVAQMFATRSLPKWSVKKFNLGLIVLTGLILFAFINGAMDIGVTQWAFASRLFGWIVLLGYLSIGYHLVHMAGIHGLRRFAETMVVTACVIIVFQFAMRWLNALEWVHFGGLTNNFEGYSGNRNAFALQLLFSSVLALGLSKYFSHRLFLLSLLHGVILLGIIYTGSLGGLISAIALLSVAFVFRFANRRFVVASILVGGALWCVPVAGVFLYKSYVEIFAVEVGTVIITGNMIQSALSGDASHSLRWETMIQGLALWWQSPVFGAGLGVFFERSEASLGLPMVIHSTPIWILSEFGLVGLGLFLWAFSLIVRHLWDSWKAGPSHRILALSLLVFGLFSLVHEIFYQRVFWLVLGSAVVLSPYGARVVAQTKKHVCHIITSLNAGGAERMLTRVVTDDRHVGSHQIVVSLMDEGVYGNDIRGCGVPLYALGMRPGILSPIAVWRLIRLLREKRPDVVITWLYHADILGFFAAKLVGIQRVYWNIRCSDMSKANQSFVSRLLVWMLARLSPFATGVIANSHAGMQFHQSLGYRNDHWQVISNGVDMKEFATNESVGQDFRAHIGLAQDAFVVGHLARYHPMKDHDNLLKAAAVVCAQNPNIHFVLVGTEVTEHNSELRTLIKDGNLEGRVHLLGARRDIPRILSAVDILVLSSAYGEGTPNVIVEAMAANVPCVVTDVGDAARVVGETGLVVPTRDAMALARAILKMADMDVSDRQHLGQAARTRIAQHYTIEGVISQYHDLIEDTGGSKHD